MDVIRQGLQIKITHVFSKTEENVEDFNRDLESFRELTVNWKTTIFSLKHREKRG